MTKRKKADPSAPWSYVKFAIEMRKASWEPVGQGVWRHLVTKCVFGSYDYDPELVEIYNSGFKWTGHSMEHTTPDPEKPRFGP